MSRSADESADEMGEVATRPVRLRAHGKLTLSLHVLGATGDGYHEIDSLMVSLADVYDRLEVALTGSGSVTLQVAGAIDDVPLDGTNLVVQAVRTLLRRVEPGAGARIRLSKRIPAGTGLGGASADAAAGLRAVAHLLPDETAGLDLAAVGADLGSDVPFCAGGGIARVGGRGERVEPLAQAGGWWAVVIVPSLRLSTAEVYAAWDELGGPRSELVVEPPSALADLAPDGLRNDLEPAAAAVCPALADFREQVAEVAGVPPLMAGSGSSHFLLAAGEDEAVRLSRDLSRAVPGTQARNSWVAVTRPGATGVSVLGG